MLAKNCTFYINVLIQFCLLSICFSNILFSTSGKQYCTCSLVRYVFHAFMQAVGQDGGYIRYTSSKWLDCLHKLMKYISYKAACTI